MAIVCHQTKQWVKGSCHKNDMNPPHVPLPFALQTVWFNFISSQDLFPKYIRLVYFIFKLLLSFMLRSQEMGVFFVVVFLMTLP